MKVFIGSSSEQYPVVKEIKRDLKNFSEKYNLDLIDWKELFERGEFINCQTWGVISKSIFTFNIAIMLLAEDDEVQSRNEQFYSTRDNVLIESGAFASVLGIENVFLLIPNNQKYKLPSDFLGLNCIIFDYARGADNSVAYKRMCDKILQIINENVEDPVDNQQQLLKNENPIRIKKGKGKL